MQDVIGVPGHCYTGDTLGEMVSTYWLPQYDDCYGLGGPNPAAAIDPDSNVYYWKRSDGKHSKSPAVCGNRNCGLNPLSDTSCERKYMVTFVGSLIWSLFLFSLSFSKEKFKYSFLFLFFQNKYIGLNIVEEQLSVSLKQSFHSWGFVFFVWENTNGYLHSKCPFFVTTILGVTCGGPQLRLLCIGNPVLGM
jgi:hypothetical protein